MPLTSAANVQVDWGDGSALESIYFGGDKPHTYATGGTKTVTITGTVTWFGGYYNSSLGNEYLSRVLSWEGVGLVSLSGAFQNASKLYEVPTTLPSIVTDLSYMFQNTVIFNGDIRDWNTSAVTNMRGMFSNAVGFNRSIYNWNTSSVMHMAEMFSGASNFNQSIDHWNTASVTDMNHMFAGASAINQSLEHWNTSSVVVMTSFLVLLWC